MKFEPIAIVGQACVLPSALSPSELWALVMERRCALGPAPAGRWRTSRERILRAHAEAGGDGASSDIGGYVEGFERRFDASGFALPAADIHALDPLFQWLLHVGREALEQARSSADRARVGACFGNLSYPCAALSRFAEHTWLSAQPAGTLGPGWAERLGLGAVDARNRFMSGLPAHLLGRALGLGGTTFALDAACASSLYAIRFACDALHDGRADLMLAGAVNCADDLFIHVGFSALGALSASGRSRPFDADADGLVPAEGAVAFALCRLADAQRDGADILGVIQGIGLSNDGRGRGLLVPSPEGQVRAMRAAYAAAELSPDAVSLLECHATGTLAGDAAELRSVGEVFAGRAEALPIAALKANIGHSITAAGGAGLLKILGAFRAGVLPPAPVVTRPRAELAAAPVRLLAAAEAWPASRPMIAAINAFGFGGNNAHLIVAAPSASAAYARPSRAARATALAPAIAVVALGARVGSGESTADFADRLLTGRVAPGRGERQARDIALSAQSVRFPPRDLEQTLPQQLLLLAATLEAVDGLALPHARTGVYVGMQCDAEIARHGARWRLPDWGQTLGAPAHWVSAARDAMVPQLGAAGVVGAMPNIVANRLSSQLDLGGPSLSISAEELSGIRALELAVRSLQTHENDAALVGAVDLGAEPVHEAARRALQHRPHAAAGDAALMLVLKRRDDAERDGDRVLALLRTGAPPERLGALRLGDAATAVDLSALFGHAHAAWGLLLVAAGVLCCAHRARPHDPRSVDAPPSSAATRLDHAAVHVRALGDASADVWIEAAEPHSPARVASSARTQSTPEAALLHFAAHRPAPELPAIPSRREPVRVLPSGSDAPPLAAPERMLPPPRDLVPIAAPALDPAPVPERLSQANRFGALAHPVEHRRSVAAAHLAYLENQANLERLFLRGREHAARALARWRPALAPPHALPPEPLGAAALPTLPTPPLAFSRCELEIHASGRISELFGPLFAEQDAYTLQVRMPRPPLLLADRVLALEAEPGSMGLGRVTTQTDVHRDSWYLSGGYMPAGIMIEAGQADLLLISYLGVDRYNRGQRVYRLLGCELTYHGSLPRAGDTLTYDIAIDAHAEQGDVRLFFFHYDCSIEGRPALSVRHGQAGFFSREELARSAGVLWSPEAQAPRPDARVDGGVIEPRRTFTTEQVRAFSERQLHACFGAGYELGLCHVRTPAIQGGRLLLLGQIDELDPRGGPWRRGYLKATTPIHPDAWFFDGHFENDPCMPGTLMFEGCLQAMAFYLAALGHTLDRDGWRFEPVPDETIQLQCRGQVLPSSKELVCELFVEELHAAPYPTLYADLLGSVDGLKAFHARRVGLRLVPDWPLSSREHQRAAGLDTPGPAGEAALAVGGFHFDYASLVACAWGRPSAAFGPMYAAFDDRRRVARLPGPPYHFMHRVAAIDGEIGVCAAGASIVIEYMPAPSAWFFEHNGHATLPFCVLLEAVLQPCGWLASYVGSALRSSADLSFRNLDGVGTVYAEVLPGQGSLSTSVRLSEVSEAGGMILQRFELTCSAGDTLVYRLETGFGFFPRTALERQVGLATSAAQLAALEAASNLEVDLRQRPARYCAQSARLADGMLLMLDRVTHADLGGGAKGLGSARAEKDVRPEEWFFKAHFFQDPVQPGSLGLEAMLQLLQFFMLHAGLDTRLVRPRFQPIALGQAMTWKYRGQVLPTQRRISVTLEITELGADAPEPYAFADASLWVDGQRIYEATRLGMCLVEAAEQLPDSRLEAPARLPARAAAGQPASDWLPDIVGCWQRWSGVSPPVVEQLYSAFFQRFVRNVHIADPAALRAAGERSLSFLGNHQVAIESTSFALLGSALTGKPLVTLSKIENRQHWLRLLFDHLLAHPGQRPLDSVRYFDRSAAETLPAILADLGHEMIHSGRSTMVHVEGTRSRSCRDPVRRMSGTLIDLSLSTNSPIVPVRFVGGLPGEPLAERAEFPVGMGRQDIHLGRPLAPDELRPLSYRERTERVKEAINALGPPSHLEEPLAPDPAFAARVRTWVEQTGASLGHAAIYRLVEQLPEPCPALAALLQGAREGRLRVAATPEGRWLAELARRLYGPHGPHVAVD